MTVTSYKDYRTAWTSNNAQKLFRLFWTFPISILARILPKGSHVIYGSMNGFKICDNSKFLFQHSSSSNSFFITKNRELCNHKNDRIIYAYSAKGFYLQLFAKKIYWTHGLNDFISPLVVGSYVIGLQHGLPGKQSIKLTKSKTYYQAKNFFTPFLNNNFCNEIWSPDEFYDSYMKEVFYPLEVTIKRQQIPRIEFQPRLPKEKKILYAPSFRKFRSFMDVMHATNIFTQNFIDELSKNNIKLILRPHPIDYDELINSGVSIPFDIDFTDDIHDNLSSYSAVISDFSGLLIDCWEMGIDSYCLCDDLEDIFETGIIYEWFYERLKLIHIIDPRDVLKTFV